VSTGAPGIDTDELLAEMPGLLRYARILVGPADAEDLVQDTVVRALESGGSFRADASLRTWLHRILYHRFVDLARARGAIPMEDDELTARIEAAWQDDDYTVDAEVVVGRAQLRDDLMDALSHLPVAQRSAVVWHDMEGMTSAEVALAAGVSLPAAKQRLRRGRAALVTLLSGDDPRGTPRPGIPMRCWQARSKVDDYLDGELTSEERVALERHLGGCPTCPGLYAGIVGVRDAMGRLRDPDTVVPDSVAARIRGATG